MSELTIFDKIIAGTIPSWRVWEDDEYLAFLTPYPNTPGFTIVVPKKNPGDNYTSVNDAAYTGLLLAARKVARRLQEAYNIKRVGLVLEGEAVPHLHAKLIPLHAQQDTAGAQVDHVEFYPHYPGYLTTIEGPRMSDEELTQEQQRIQGTP